MVDLILLHPKIVHFPIVLIALALLFEMLFIWKKESFYKKASLWMIHLGFISGLAAMTSGLIAADIIGHDSVAHDHVHEHRDIIFFALSIWFLFILGIRYLQKLKEKTGSIFKITISMLICGILYTGAHEGGELVYKYGIGVREVTKKSNIIPKSKDHKEDNHDHEHEHEH